MTQSQKEYTRQNETDVRVEAALLKRLETLAVEQNALELELREVRNRLGTNKHDKNSAYCIEGRCPENKPSR